METYPHEWFPTKFSLSSVSSCKGWNQDN